MMSREVWSWTSRQSGRRISSSAAIQPLKYSSSTSTMLPRPPRVIRYTVPSDATSLAMLEALRTRSVTEMILYMMTSKL